jgi:lipoyl-dependent peroxiredoxin
MTEATIPSGENTQDSQADGSAQAGARQESIPESEQLFRASAVWTGDGAGAGEVRVADGGFGIPIAGARALGGAGGMPNPEELLLAAVAACFINTWAIFIKKLKISYASPAIRLTGTLGKDPAGGFQMTGAIIYARVPEALLEEDRAKIEKSLQLSEKYCIISKVAHAAMPVKVEIESV